MRGFTARNTPYLGLVDRRPVVCRNLVMGFWVPLHYAAKTNYRTKNYQLARHVLENGLAALQVNLVEIQVELFASQQQHIMQLYC